MGETATMTPALKRKILAIMDGHRTTTRRSFGHTDLVAC
jgi:hypothetical protein